MAIQFKCPQGHKLSAADSKAGKSGKCPACGEAFVIPDPGSGGRLSDSGVSDSDVSMFEETDSSPTLLAAAAPDQTAAEESAADDPNLIVFLCPNGHKLNGPKSLQGRPGQCPHCGAKFRIPNYDEDEEPDGEGRDDTQIDDDIPVGTLLDDDEEIAEGIAEGIIDEDVPLGDPIAPQDATVVTSAVHPMARLFDRLWREKSNGAVVELHLHDAGTVVPDRYAADLSQHAHGVFSVRGQDGSYTITAIAWDAVTKVSVRGVKQLPQDLFGN